MLRVGVVLGGLVVVAVLGNAVMSAWRASSRMGSKEPLQLLASTTTSAVRQQGAPMMTAAAAAPAAESTAPSAKRADAVKPALLTLKVPEGRTGLRDSMYVERHADTAVVHFDTELARTRRRDKFETTVRATLPVLYGAPVDSMLATLPDGAITGDRDLVSEVTVRGVRLPIPAGGTIELWPVTRPGRDGPLVVGYRARVTP
ncbi:MAG TPA: hypothetical protein VF034_01615 [Gemmatimonadaceae bacterium]